MSSKGRAKSPQPSISLGLTLLSSCPHDGCVVTRSLRLHMHLNFFAPPVDRDSYRRQALILYVLEPVGSSGLKLEGPMTEACWEAGRAARLDPSLRDRSGAAGEGRGSQSI